MAIGFPWRKKPPERLLSVLNLRIKTMGRGRPETVGGAGKCEVLENGKALA